MNFLHYEIDSQDGDVVEVTLDCQANVRLLDGSNFSSFRSGRRHTYRGGLMKSSPVKLAPPHAGTTGTSLSISADTPGPSALEFASCVRGDMKKQARASVMTIRDLFIGVNLKARRHLKLWERGGAASVSQRCSCSSA